MNKKQRIIVSTIIVVALLAYLGFASFNSGNIYYYTVSEVVAKNSIERPVNVNGTIVKGSTTWSPENQTLTFKMSDGVHTITVVYKGNMPSNYQEDIPVVATGTYQEGVLTASKLVLKCPSKYEAKIDTTT